MQNRRVVRAPAPGTRILSGRNGPDAVEKAVGGDPVDASARLGKDPSSEVLMLRSRTAISCSPSIEALARHPEGHDGGEPRPEVLDAMRTGNARSCIPQSRAVGTAILRRSLSGVALALLGLASCRLAFRTLRRVAWRRTWCWKASHLAPCRFPHAPKVIHHESGQPLEVAVARREAVAPGGYQEPRRRPEGGKTGGVGQHQPMNLVIPADGEPCRERAGLGGGDQNRPLRTCQPAQVFDPPSHGPVVQFTGRIRRDRGDRGRSNGRGTREVHHVPAGLLPHRAVSTCGRLWRNL